MPPPPVLAAGHRMGRLVVVELPILSHLGSIARNRAGLSQSNVAIDCAEDHVNDQMPPQSIYRSSAPQCHQQARACPVARPETLLLEHDGAG